MENRSALETAASSFLERPLWVAVSTGHCKAEDKRNTQVLLNPFLQPMPSLLFISKYFGLVVVLLSKDLKHSQEPKRKIVRRPKGYSCRRRPMFLTTSRDSSNLLRRVSETPCCFRVYSGRSPAVFLEPSSKCLPLPKAVAQIQ